ncbi:MAG: carboxypeptidase-like regulatory domain-containing protein [Bacteroidetes bacterium]|nr:carboxypeptidase-like regulatory domain-containing protein [Bacteroidota bacterium]
MATVKGRVTDKSNKPIEYATVAVSGTKYGTTTDSLGNYSLAIPANEDLIVAFQSINYQKQEQKVKLTVNEVITINKQLVFKPGEILTITVYADKRKILLKQKLIRACPKLLPVLRASRLGSSLAVWFLFQMN